MEYVALAWIIISVLIFLGGSIYIGYKGERGHLPAILIISFFWPLFLAVSSLFLPLLLGIGIRKLTISHQSKSKEVSNDASDL